MSNLYKLLFCQPFCFCSLHIIQIRRIIWSATVILHVIFSNQLNFYCYHPCYIQQSATFNQGYIQQLADLLLLSAMLYSAISWSATVILRVIFSNQLIRYFYPPCYNQQSADLLLLSAMLNSQVWSSFGLQYHGLFLHFSLIWNNLLVFTNEYCGIQRVLDVCILNIN